MNSILDKTKQFFKKQENIILTVALLVLLVLAVTGIYKCPFLLIFKIPCPFCGISRAFRSAATFHMREAFGFHPLWPAIGLALLLEILRRLKLIRISNRVYNIGAILLAIAILICYLFRYFI